MSNIFTPHPFLVKNKIQSQKIVKRYKYALPIDGASSLNIVAYPCSLKVLKINGHPSKVLAPSNPIRASCNLQFSSTVLPVNSAVIWGVVASPTRENPSNIKDWSSSRRNLNESGKRRWKVACDVWSNARIMTLKGKPVSCRAFRCKTSRFGITCAWKSFWIIPLENSALICRKSCSSFKVGPLYFKRVGSPKVNPESEAFFLWIVWTEILLKGAPVNQKCQQRYF